MKLILDAQKEFISEASNQPGFDAQVQGGEFKLNFQFEGFVSKLKEIGETFKQYANESPMAKAVATTFEGNKDENMLSGFLEGLGFEGLADKYVANRQLEREKGEYVTNFMEKNPAAQVLTEETARAAAAEEFELKRTGQMPVPTQLVDSAARENMLEAAEKEQDKEQVSLQSFKDLESIKSLSEQNLPLLDDIKMLNAEMLAVLTYIANNSMGGGGVAPSIDIPTGDKNKKGGKKPKSGGKSIGGKVLDGAKGLLGGIGGKTIAVAGAGMTAYDIYDREKQVDAGTLDREEATKENTKDVAGFGTGLAGAKLAAMAAAPLMPLAGPAAPLVPIVAGLAGFFLGDVIGRNVTEVIQNDIEAGKQSGAADMIDPEQQVFAPAFNSPIPMQSSTNALDRGASGGVEINQSNNSQVNAPTTVINNNVKQMKSPRNEDPTFMRYTQQRAYP